MYKLSTLVLSFLLLSLSSSVSANTITVCGSGCNQITIQSAVNAASAGDTILINVNGAITESGISISKNLVIRGLGQNTTVVQAHAVRGSAIHRVFYIYNNVNVTIENLTVQNGKETADPTMWNGSGCGILVDGTTTTVTLNSVTVKNCDNVGAGGAGAGITLGGTTTVLYLNNCRLEGNVANNGSSGALYLSANGGTCQARNTVFHNNSANSSGGATSLGGTINASFINCTFSNNQALAGGSGGAINSSSAIPTIYNCTFSANSAANQGGALRISGGNITNCTFYNNIAINGGAISRGTSAAGNALYIVNCTISGNSATGVSPVGAGFQNASTTALVHMVNTVIANSSAGSDCYINTASTLTTNQKNYVGTASFTTGTTTFAYTSGANLGLVGNNGGLTSTIAVLPGSILINNGATAVAGVTIPTKDQRNLPLSGIIDIGAYEYNATETMSITYTPLSNAVTGGIRNLLVSITDNVGVPVAGGFVPRLHFKKNTGNWTSVAGTLSGGNATSGTWSFNIDHNQVGGVANGDVISYFITAQDNTTGAYAKSNLSGLVAGSVIAVTTPPSTPSSYSYSLSTLPIKLVSFQAASVRGGTALSWKTVEYGDTEKYELLKSTDGMSFHAISAHQPNTAGVYDFFDNMPGAECYYQLRMIEKTGVTTYSKVLFVRTRETKVRVLDNIVKGNAVPVKFEGVQGKVAFQLVDMNGRVLRKGSIAASSQAGVQSINTGSIAQGKYYLVFSFSDSPAVTLAFIKE